MTNHPIHLLHILVIYVIHICVYTIKGRVIAKVVITNIFIMVFLFVIASAANGLIVIESLM